MKKIIAVVVLCLLILVVLLPSFAFASSTSLTVRVDSVNDNCRVYYNGSAWVLSTTELTSAGYYDSIHQRMGSGFRFNNVTVPPRMSITQAYLIFTAYNAVNTGITVNTVIRGELSVSPVAFTTYANFVGRSRTSQVVYWQSIPAWTSGSSYSSPNLSSIVQAIVDQPNWQYSNSLVLFWDDTANQSTNVPNASRHAYSYSFSSTMAVSLYIVYDSVSTYTLSDATLADIVTLKAGVVNLQTTVDNLQASVKVLSSSLADVSTQSNAVSSQVGKITTSVAAIQSSVQSLQSTASTLQTSVATVDRNVTSVSTQVKAAADSLTSVKADIATLSVTVAALSKQEDISTVSLQGKVSSLRSWLIVLLIVQCLILLLLFVQMRRGRESMSKVEGE